MADTGLAAASVTCTLKLNVPAVVGVPEIFAEARESPAGKEDPVVRLQVSVPAPPVAANVALYAVPTVPSVSVVVVMLGVGLITTWVDFDFPELVFDVAVTVTVKFEVTVVGAL